LEDTKVRGRKKKKKREDVLLAGLGRVDVAVGESARGGEESSGR